MKNVDRLRSRLKEAFGYKKFRPGQSEACAAAVEGRDTVILMPTGSGKSLCYQLPGLELAGVTVVVSPLISLAEDQAASLRERGIEAVIFNSSKTTKQIRQFRDDVRSEKAEFVFTTPERLQQTDLCELLAEVGVDLFVIDEAHCVSQWGHDFRPDYLCLSHARQRLGNPPVLAMTATASERTVDEIVSSLKLKDPVIVANGVYRSNLQIGVVPCRGSAEKNALVRTLLASDDGLLSNEPAIVYCSTVKDVERLTVDFADLAAPVLGYHGRMKKASRLESQNAFMDGPPAVMFATNAFGMGIDKANIRRVIHYSAPNSIEAYYQEIGRAGRDGKQAICTLLYDPSDTSVLKMFAGGHLDASQLSTAHHCLRQGIERWGDESNSVALKDLKPISPLGRQTLLNCLQLLATRGACVPSGRGRWISLMDALPESVTDRLADIARTRTEDRQISLRQMIEFAETRSCRWARLLKHFNDNASVEVIACNCDVCEPTALAESFSPSIVGVNLI